MNLSSSNVDELRAQLKEYYADEMRRVWQTPGAETPEWYNQFYNLYTWNGENSFWLERGMLARECMREGDHVLDLCCGDGFYSKYFFSEVANHICAIDHSADAIEHAKKYNQMPNITYLVSEAQSAVLYPTYNVAVLDAAIEHFSPEDADLIVGMCKDILVGGGVLHGSNRLGVGWHPTHRFNVETVEPTKALLQKHFKHVHLWTTHFKNRDVFYFRASQTSHRVIPYNAKPV